MTDRYLDLQQTGQFPKLLLDYLGAKPELKPFYGYFPELQNFRNLIENKSDFEFSRRETLVDALTRQYAGTADAPDFRTLLDPRTFTVTTGHQLNLFGGPLYIIYKIITTINLVRLLQENFPEYNFVPVYWMASEDHDFAEIASVHSNGRTYTWDIKSEGAVGRLNPNGLAQIAREIPGAGLFEKAYRDNETLAGAVRQYMHELFGKDGLVTLDADDKELKKIFLPVITDELENQRCSGLVNQTSEELNALGYDTPVHAREINLFYLVDNLRERIVCHGADFRVLRTRQTFSLEEILKEAEHHPERFSPNVVLRPLYQEFILPNLAYIGGPSEVPYWMQLKAVFDFYKTPFPALIPRNFALYVTTAEQRRIKKLNLKYEDFFIDKNQLRRGIVERYTTNNLSLDEEKTALKSLFNEVSTKAKAVDVTLEAAALAERTRWLKSFGKLERRIHKAEERKHETVLTQLQTVLDCFFPGGVPQERYANFIEFNLTNRHFIPGLFRNLAPLDFRFNILKEGELNGTGNEKESAQADLSD